MMIFIDIRRDLFNLNIYTIKTNFLSSILSLSHQKNLRLTLMLVYLKGNNLQFDGSINSHPPPIFRSFLVISRVYTRIFQFSHTKLIYEMKIVGRNRQYCVKIYLETINLQHEEKRKCL
jgi:hypothetical protein